MLNSLQKIQIVLGQIINTAISIVRLCAFSRPIHSVLKRKNKNCIVLGNGPSLNNSIEFLIKNKNSADLFCVNMFSNSAEYAQLKPEYYLLLDDEFINPNHPLANKAIQSLVSNTTWPLNLIIPYPFKHSKYFTDLMKKNENINLHFINYVIFESFDWLNFWVFNKRMAMPQCQNVLVALTFQCINMGYEKVYLLGADHSWHENIRLNEQNEMEFLDKHFYGEKKLNTKSVFGKSYLAAQFLSLHKAFKGYEILANYAQNQQVKVLNASTKSYIDVFEKIKLTEIGT